MNTSFAIAAALSLLTWGLHAFMGGPEVAKPLLESEMEPVAKYTNYYCWHLTTLMLFAMALGFAYSAAFPGGTDLAVFLTLLSASFGIWSVVLMAMSKRKLLELPQWSLFAAITAAGLVGVIP
jgi:hypothetical protein